jgi:CheY-like chemotaxis protein
VTDDERLAPVPAAVQVPVASVGAVERSIRRRAGQGGNRALLCTTAQRTGTQQREKPGRPVGSRRRVNGRILIVDDDHDWRQFVRYALEDLGYEGVEAASGDEALALMQREHFPIVLLDVRIPGLSGTEVIARMPEPTPRVVLLTSAPAEQVRDILSNHPCYYLPKDAGPDALTLIIRSLESHGPH